MNRNKLEDVAASLGIGASILRRWSEVYQIPGTRTSTGKRYFSDRDLIAFRSIKLQRERGIDQEEIQKTPRTGSEHPLGRNLTDVTLEDAKSRIQVLEAIARDAFMTINEVQLDLGPNAKLTALTRRINDAYSKAA